jgi:peptidyl-prolyl cis-trans isomerase A (cyclophilin A)
MFRLRLIALAGLVSALMSSAEAQSLVRVQTPLGPMVIELFDRDKPITAGNFLAYLDEGLYRDTFVQRWVPGFVIQGGGYFVTNRLGAGAAFSAVPTGPAIPNEYGAGRVYGNLYGTIAMARVGGVTNSATSQWFINLADNSSLDAVDGGFTVFGRVALGTNILNRFNNTSLTNGIWLANAGGALATLPVLSSQPTYNDLVYTDMGRLAPPRLQVAAQPGGTRVLSWTTLAGFTNHLEWSDVLPPRWQMLASRPGDGGLATVTDSATVTQRVYRLRIQ